MINLSDVFIVMGIWNHSSDGTDINSVDVNFKKNLVVTGDDFSGINVFNYPCVVKKAPGIVRQGHSSHVLSVTFCVDGNNIASVGGNDQSVIVWQINRLS